MPFAIIQSGGKQYSVEKGSRIKVEKLDGEAGKPVVFDAVLLTHDETAGIKLGTPFVEGAKVEGKVVEQGKGKKVVVFKYKPKKRYRKKQGHRQTFTLVEITSLGEPAFALRAMAGKGKTARTKTEKPKPKQKVRA